MPAARALSGRPEASAAGIVQPGVVQPGLVPLASADVFEGFRGPFHGGCLPL